MKLLHVISKTDPESGGPIEAILRISVVLIREGHEAAVVSLEEEGEVAHRNFPFPLIGLGRGTKPYSYNPRLASWLKQNARNFDVVVLHGLWNYTSFGAWRSLRDGSTPYYIFAHGMMDPWFRERYPLKHLAKQAYWTLAEGRVLSGARSVLFTCEEERLRARGVFKGYPYREAVAQLGTADPHRESAAQTAAFGAATPALENRNFLLYIGRIHPKKGCDLLIRAFAGVASQFRPDLQLVMAGPDEVGWSLELQQLAEKLGIASRIHWPGMLKGDAKWGAFRAADAMILPSHQENFGFVVAEAMACSTPVLISNKVNIWREVRASEAGLVEPDTAEGTSNLICRFYAQSSEQREWMTRNARTGFLRYFDIEATAHRFAEVIGFPNEPVPARSPDALEPAI